LPINFAYTLQKSKGSKSIRISVAAGSCTTITLLSEWNSISRLGRLLPGSSRDEPEEGAALAKRSGFHFAAIVASGLGCRLSKFLSKSQKRREAWVPNPCIIEGTLILQDKELVATLKNIFWGER